MLINSTAWQIAGPTSFRLGSRSIFSRKPQHKGYGTNLQNRSPQESRIYKPRLGNVFLQADQAGAEALCVAYLCRPGNFRSLFENKIKPHVFVAMHLFTEYWSKEHPAVQDIIKLDVPDIPSHPDWKKLESAIKKHDKNYAIGKMVCHASNYGMEAPAFQLNTLIRSEGKLCLSLSEADKFLGTYHRLFPEITSWQREVKQQLDTTRTIRNMFGYPRYFGGLIEDKTYKEAYAQNPQSTVGCITHIAYTAMQSFIEESGIEWNLLVNKHDSILLENPEEDIPIAGRVLQASLEQELTGRDGVKFNMRTELACGRNWGKYSEKKNPDGMREISL